MTGGRPPSGMARWLSERWWQLSLIALLALALLSYRQQSQRDYVASQRRSCYSTYSREGQRWNNVIGFDYDRARDVCIVRYQEITYPPVQMDTGMRMDTTPNTMDLGQPIDTTIFTREF